jgi:hypothetical protein
LLKRSVVARRSKSRMQRFLSEILFSLDIGTG